MQNPKLQNLTDYSPDDKPWRLISHNLMMLAVSICVLLNLSLMQPACAIVAASCVLAGLPLKTPEKRVYGSVRRISAAFVTALSASGGAP